MRSTHVIPIAAMILLASVPGAALAQPAAQDQQQAREFFNQAEVHKRQGDEHAARGEQGAAREAYGKAAEAYTRAFELYEHPAFIYNLAQMRRLRGERQRAIRAYETFLVVNPDGPQAATARTFIAQLTMELDVEASKAETTPLEPASDTEPVTPPEPEPAAETGPETTATDSTPPPPERTSLDVSDTRADPSRGRGLRVAGVVSMAAGALGVGLGIKFGLDALSASRELEKETDEPWDPAPYARGEAAERNMFIALGVGGAAVITGSVLYVVGVATSEDRPLAVRPSTTQDGFLVHVSGTFWAF